MIPKNVEITGKNTLPSCFYFAFKALDCHELSKMCGWGVHLSYPYLGEKKNKSHVNFST